MKRKKNPTPHTSDHTADHAAVDNESFTLMLREDGQLQWVKDGMAFTTVGDISIDDIRASQEFGKKLTGKGLKKPSTEI